jgi:hypothetical protein
MTTILLKVNSMDLATDGVVRLAKAARSGLEKGKTTKMLK